MVKPDGGGGHAQQRSTGMTASCVCEMSGVLSSGAQHVEGYRERGKHHERIIWEAREEGRSQITKTMPAR